MVIRENEIFKRLETVVNTALGQLGITGFQVMQASQPIPTSDHACILISRIDIHRYGWQGVTYDKKTEYDPTYWQNTEKGLDYEAPEGADLTVKEKWNYIDEATYQISAFLPRKVSDTTNTVTSYDSVSAIATWVMSPTGIAALNEVGFQPLRISDVRTPVQQDDSNIPQFNPNFDMKFMVYQESGVKLPMVTGIRFDLEKV